MVKSRWQKSEAGEQREERKELEIESEAQQFGGVGRGAPVFGVNYL